MKPKPFLKFLTIIPILFLMACTSTPNFSTTKQEQYQMNNTVQYTNKTLWEMFGNSEDWELHVYSVPLSIDFRRPLVINDLKSKTIVGNYYQYYSNSHEIVSAINILKDIPFSYDRTPLVSVRILLEFKHKYKNETISLLNNGYTLVFYAERNSDGQISKLPAIVISDEQYHVLKQLFSK